MEVFTFIWRLISGSLFIATILMGLWVLMLRLGRRRKQREAFAADRKERMAAATRASTPDPTSNAAKYAALLGKEDSERLSDEAMEAVLAERREALKQGTRKMRVLVVDYQPVIANTLKIIFQYNGGYEALSAYSKAEAMQIIVHDRPDFIWTDMVLERMDSGIEIYRYLREHNLPIGMLLCTGRFDGLKDAGVAPEDFPHLPCFSKPVHPTEGIAMLRSYFEEQAQGAKPNTVM